MDYLGIRIASTGRTPVETCADAAIPRGVETGDLYLTIDPRALVDAVAAVKVRSDAAQAKSHPSAETGREQYAFAYDAVTIEELERAVTARRLPTGARP